MSRAGRGAFAARTVDSVVMTVHSEPLDPPATPDHGSATAPPSPGSAGRRSLVTLGGPRVLVWLGRDMTFYHDEFAFLLLRDLSMPASSGHTTST